MPPAPPQPKPEASRTTKVLALSLGNSLTMAVGLVSGMVLARVLSQRDLATYRQTFLAYGFAAPLLSLALPEALYFFLPRHKGQERQVLLENLLLLALAGSVFSLFLLCGGTRLLALRFSNPDLARTLPLLIIYPLLVLPAGALGACLVSQGKIVSLTTYTVVSRLVLVTLLILVALLAPTPRSLVLVNVAVSAISLAAALWLMFRVCPGTLTAPSASRMWAMVAYSAPMGLATMLGTLTLKAVASEGVLLNPSVSHAD